MCSNAESSKKDFDLAIYVELLQRFVDGRMTADEFEAAYLDFHRRYREPESDAIFEPLNELFYAVDDYHPDPEVQMETGAIDAEALRRRANDVLQRLMGL
jgi:hypothetical protein